MALYKQLTFKKLPTLQGKQHLLSFKLIYEFSKSENKLVYRLVFATNYINSNLIS